MTRLEHAEKLLAAILYDRGGSICINTTSLDWIEELLENRVPVTFLTTPSPDGANTAIHIGIPTHPADPNTPNGDTP